jgi:hypothetical protein
LFLNTTAGHLFAVSGFWKKWKAPEELTPFNHPFFERHGFEGVQGVVVDKSGDGALRWEPMGCMLHGLTKPFQG